MIVPLRRSTLILAILVSAVLARSNAWSADASNPADYSELRHRIAEGRAGDVLKLAQDALTREPDDWYANSLQAEALTTLGRIDEAEAALIRWADRDTADPKRVDAILQLYRGTARWESAAGMTQRIVALAAPTRIAELRDLVDLLCNGQRCELAAAAVKHLLPGAPDDSRAAVIRALVAATKKDVKGMIAEIPAFPAAGDGSPARAEALTLVSRRAASAIDVTQVPGPKIDYLPSTGAAAPESLSVMPVVKTKVEPVYPSVAKRARIEGKVILRVLILPSGEVVVTGLCTASNPMFMNAAAEAVSQWMYEPGRLGDLPVSSDYVIRVDFRFR